MEDDMTTTPDYAAIKQRQHATWSAGDYAMIGTTLQIVGERLCEAVNLRAGSGVIDVAAGNGNASLAAAHRFATVTSTDYVDALLERGKERAAAERLNITFKQADAEALPFADESFDVALSTFGVMFTPQQEKSAAELLRVVKKGGKIALANWTPESFIGQVLKTVSKRVPPVAGLKPPTLWGTDTRLSELFTGHTLASSQQSFVFRYESPEHWLQVFRSYYGPITRAFATLEGKKADALEADLMALLRHANIDGANSMIIPSSYLETVVTKN
jgi:ubiquinone/menaquinone biosynthesis C-methylase UbiE